MREKKEGNFFNRILLPQKKDCLLDLGGGNGVHIHEIINNEEIDNVTISDISESDLLYAKNEFGYKISLLNEGDKLPFSDNEFDIVFCNSVIEHVTIPKNNIWSFKSTKGFKKLSLKRHLIRIKNLCVYSFREIERYRREICTYAKLVAATFFFESFKIRGLNRFKSSLYLRTYFNLES